MKDQYCDYSFMTKQKEVACGRLVATIENCEKGEESNSPSNMAEGKKLRLAGVEGGGTSFKLGIAEGNASNIIEQHQLRTKSPDETVEEILKWLEARQPFDSLGVSCFGPLDLNKRSKTWGCITSTPKKAWQDYNLLQKFVNIHGPRDIDTDVNAAALGELIHGGHGDAQSLAYVTVGTGIGVGCVVNGSPVHGMMHPESGHMKCPKADGDTYAGCCPFHGDCIEGMANSQAISERAGVTIDQLGDLDDDHIVWKFTAHYLAHLCVNLTLAYSPEVIVLGGGVLNRECLFPMIRGKFTSLLNGYIRLAKLEGGAARFIVPSKHDQPGLVGALELGNQARLNQQKKE
eukprot:Clim_evm15s227 gene=Clim_evmTU15s227